MIMNELQRISPVLFNSTPLKTEKRDNWNIVMEYSDEGNGPWLIDLSHRPRFDLQSSNLNTIKPFGLTVPEKPGNCILEKGILANRMNKTQVSLFHLSGKSVDMPNESCFTEVTESTLCVALIGEAVFSICEKLTALDFTDPERKAPFLLQGPFSHVPCQIITLNKDGRTSGLVLTSSRGYGRDMIHSILDAGEEFNLKPAGEAKFTDWVNSL
jgi:hypothetical protein